MKILANGGLGVIWAALVSELGRHNGENRHDILWPMNAIGTRNLCPLA